MSRRFLLLTVTMIAVSLALAGCIKSAGGLGDRASSFAVSPNGKLYAYGVVETRETCTNDGTSSSDSCYTDIVGGAVRIFDRSLGHEIAIFGGHGSAVTAVAYSPDGKLLASGSNDRNIAVWDSKTGDRLFVLTGHRSGINGLAFSPDGHTLVSTAIADAEARIWNAATGVLIGTLFRSGYGLPTSPVFSPDGKMLALPSGIFVSLWDVPNWTAGRTLAGHTNVVHSASFSPDGTLVATAAADNAVRIWDSQTGSALKILSGDPNTTYPVAFSPDGRMLATGGEVRHTFRFVPYIRLWDVQSGAALKSIEHPGERMIAMRYSSDGSTLATLSDDGRIRFWDAASGEQRGTVN